MSCSSSRFLRRALSLLARLPRAMLSHGGARAMLLAFAAAAFLPAQAQTKVRIGLIGTNESQLPIVVAIDQGLFKAEHIDVEPVSFQGGGIAVQALVGGSIDLADFATDHVLRLSNRGIDTRFLIGIDRYITHILVVPAASPYKRLADLRGKRIVVSAPGSYSDNVLRWTLKNEGLDPDKEFTLLSAGGGAAARAGLDTGKFDAVMSTTPDIIEDDLNFPGKYRILYDWRKIPTSGQAVVAKKAWIDAHPDAAKGIVRAVLKAEQLIQTDPAVVQQAVRKLFPERSDAYARQLAAAVPALISPDGRISDAGFLKMTEILRTIEPELKPLKLSDLDLTNTLLER